MSPRPFNWSPWLWFMTTKEGGLLARGTTLGSSSVVGKLRRNGGSNSARSARYFSSWAFYLWPWAVLPSNAADCQGIWIHQNNITRDIHNVKYIAIIIPTGFVAVRFYLLANWVFLFSYFFPRYWMRWCFFTYLLLQVSVVSGKLYVSDIIFTATTCQRKKKFQVRLPWKNFTHLVGFYLGVKWNAGHNYIDVTIFEQRTQLERKRVRNSTNLLNY